MGSELEPDDFFEKFRQFVDRPAETVKKIELKELFFDIVFGNSPSCAASPSLMSIPITPMSIRASQFDLVIPDATKE